MRFTNVDHIGVAVADLAAAVATYTLLFGTGPSRTETVATEKVQVAFFEVGQTRVELLAATDPSSPIAKFLAKRGPGVHHIAFSVPNLDAAVAELAAEGMAPVGDSDRTGACGHRVAFLHPKQTGGVLIELVERLS